MKKILIFGATGQLGKRIVEKMHLEGWNISAFVRATSDIEQLEKIGASLIYGDVNNAESVEVAFSEKYDLVISSLGPSNGKLTTISVGISNIVQHLKADKLIAVGGAGILPDPEHDAQFLKPHFPAILKPIAKEHWSAYLQVAASGIDYVYVCPPRMLPGSFGDQYKTLIEESLNSPAASVSFEACATCIINEAREPQFQKKRISIFSI